MSSSKKKKKDLSQSTSVPKRTRINSSDPTTPLPSTEATFAEKIAIIHHQTLPRFEFPTKLNEWSDHQIHHDIPTHIIRFAIGELAKVARSGHPFHDDINKLANIKPVNNIPSISNKEQKRWSGGMNALPSAIISSIFSFLDQFDELLSRCMLVSRYWFNIVPLSSSCTHWDDTQQPFGAIRRLAPNWLPNIQHFSSMSAYRSPRLRNLLREMTSGQRLQSLTIEPDDDIIDDHLSIPSSLIEIIGQFSHLIRLKLTEVVKLNATPLLQHPSLRHIEIEDIRSILSTPITVSSELQYLKLAITPKEELEDGGDATLPPVLVTLDLSNINRLHTLSLTGCWDIKTSGKRDKKDNRKSGSGNRSLTSIEYILRPRRTQSWSHSNVLAAQESFMKALKQLHCVTHIRIDGVVIDELPPSVERWEYANLHHCQVFLLLLIYQLMKGFDITS
jgi:hypothetical protein